jgi:DDE domain
MALLRWVYLYRAIDQHGQVIDVLALQKRDLAATLWVPETRSRPLTCCAAAGDSPA